MVAESRFGTSCYVGDLLDLFDATVERPERSVGEAFTAGGGWDYTLSLVELFDFLEEKIGRDVPRSVDGWRTGAQRVFYCGTSKAKKRLGWAPEIPSERGIWDFKSSVRSQA